MNRFPSIAAFAGWAALLTLAALPAAADWLVTTDGSRIETKGPWEVKGRQVLFTLPNGTLSSVRLSEVDLEASERVTERAKAPKPPPPKPAPKKEAVLVITDADVPKAPRRPPAAAEDEEAGDEVTAVGTLSVVDWGGDFDQDLFGTVVSGTLRNGTDQAASEVAVLVRLLGPTGQVLGATTAVLGQRSLAPGGETSLRAVFPGVDAFSRAEFQTRFTGLRPVEPEPATDDGDQADTGG